MDQPPPPTRKALVLGACGLLIGSICALEANTPDQLSFGTLYVFPVAWASWVGGLRWGLAAGCAASAAWAIGNYATSAVYDRVALRMWTVANDLLTYGATAWLVDRFRKVLEGERAATRALADALDQVETLEGMFPVCAWCRRVRDDRGYWGRIEDYLARRKGTLVSHGICPDCSAKAKAELARVRDDAASPHA